ncbi:15168_t:CDS:2, partial [Acaulospora colombiana]
VWQDKRSEILHSRGYQRSTSMGERQMQATSYGGNCGRGSKLRGRQARISQYEPSRESSATGSRQSIEPNLWDQHSKLTVPKSRGPKPFMSQRTVCWERDDYPHDNNDLQCPLSNFSATKRRPLYKAIST